MDKKQELQEWKNKLRQLVPDIMEQLDWIKQGKVKAEVNPNCPEKLREVAERLVEIQNNSGEYQRNQISKTDVERIKYFSKQNSMGFDDVVKLAVLNSRYMGKTAIEARGVAGFILEIQSVFNKYYNDHGALPINAMNAEVKRACRNFTTDVTLKDKIEAIIEVFLPELQGINIVDRDLTIEKTPKPELSNLEIRQLIEYFNGMAKNGRIDACFKEVNQKEFLRHCKILSKSGVSLDKFLTDYTGLTFSKCYEIQVVPAVEYMVNMHKAKTGTTTNITHTDPYLRHKIEIAEKATGKYSMVELVKELNINGDNEGRCRDHLTENEILMRRNVLLRRLKTLYPSGIIDKDFIKEHPAEYEDLKLVSNRSGFANMDAFLNTAGFKRERFHESARQAVVYLSEGDLNFYHFNQVSPERLKSWGLKELEPSNFIGVYNKLIALGNDHKQLGDEDDCVLGK